MDSAEYLIVPIWQAFVWLDEGLQNYLRLRGWPQVTRPQSMVMNNVVAGVTRPSDIARNLGVSRQAIHVTLNQMVEIGLLELIDDPEDRRSKIVAISATGSMMRQSAQEAMRLLARQLRRRIGDAHVDSLKTILAADWGAPVEWSDADFSAIGAARPARAAPGD
jgi:DNA-binding MarR family transcriptional regulator